MLDDIERILFGMGIIINEILIVMASLAIPFVGPFIFVITNDYLSRLRLPILLTIMGSIIQMSIYIVLGNYYKTY